MQSKTNLTGTDDRCFGYLSIGSIAGRTSDDVLRFLQAEGRGELAGVATKMMIGHHHQNKDGMIAVASTRGNAKYLLHVVNRLNKPGQSDFHNKIQRTLSRTQSNAQVLINYGGHPTPVMFLVLHAGIRPITLMAKKEREGSKHVVMWGYPHKVEPDSCHKILTLAVGHTLHLNTQMLNGRLARWRIGESRTEASQRKKYLREKLTQYFSRRTTGS